MTSDSGSKTNLNKVKSASTSSSSIKDIWSLIREQKKGPAGEGENHPVETFLFVAGSANCGKSTIISKFLDKDEIINPSVALEYTFGRRSRGVQGGIKDLAHIYELAGGTRLSDLLHIPLNEANVHMSTYLFCVDLSKPSEALETLDHFLFSVRAKIGAILDRLEAKGSRRPQALRAHAMKRLGPEHPDVQEVRPFPVPLLIIGTKYDALKSMESEPRKMLCKTLRYLAHTNGASLIFHSSLDEPLNIKTRQFISHLNFRTSAPKTIITDHNKPILVIAGQDFYSQIGLPPSEISSDAVGKKNIVPYETWKKDYSKFFPANPDVEQANFEVNLSLFPEASVDALRERKNLELEKIKANNERNSRDGLLNSNGSKNDLKKSKSSYSRAKANQMNAE